MSLIVRTDTLEKQQKVIEALRGIGVEAVNEDEESPITDVLFYLSRMNSKLDNLGQLKHLYELATLVRDVLKKPSHRETADERLLRQTQENFSITYYNLLCKKYNHWPLAEGVHEMSAKYLTKEQIDALFTLWYETI